MAVRPSDLTTYRSDIDGLRAVAVLSVIAFHLNKSILTGGFLGVDVFFVISGFLISRNIMQEIERRTFSIAEFYRRRVKRIAPVMLVVVALTCLFAFILQLPDDFRDTAKSGVFSLASLANVYFWIYQDTSYFAADSAQLPLLHLWSLGVEEQFYFLWPAFLVLFARPSRNVFFLTAVWTVAALSFLAGDLLYDSAPSFVYYMLPTRVGELLLGALVAISVLRNEKRLDSRRVVSAIAICGAAGLGLSLLYIDENMRFPGWTAIPPTLATAMLIFAGHHHSNPVSRALSITPLRWVGLVSYSAYLWHWPLLSLYRYGYGEPDLMAGAAALFLTFALAWLSYTYVEQPFRHSSGSATRVIAGQYLIPAGLLGMLLLVAIYPERIGLDPSASPYSRELAVLRDQTRPAYHYDWVCQRQRLTSEDLTNPRCLLGAGASEEPPAALLWGDSHAAHYIGVVEAFASQAGFRFRNVEVGSCPPLLTDPAPFVKGHRLQDCDHSLQLMPSVLENFDVVIMSADWLSYGPDFLSTFFETTENLIRKGKRVVLLGRVPQVQEYDRRCRQKALTYPMLECSYDDFEPSSKVIEVNLRLKEFAEHKDDVAYFDVVEYLCPNGLCSPLDSSGALRYFDEYHLSLPASSRLGEEILANAGVPEAFRFNTQ